MNDLDERIDRFEKSLRTEIDSATTLEWAAQLFADRFYETFGEIAVLARVFVTLPVRTLPNDDREILALKVRERESEAAVAGDVVLALVGTRGVAATWSDRRTSREHRVIPIHSHALIEEAPMISRLLSELGVSNLDTRSDWQYVKRSDTGEGLFFVGDARTATDARGRAIIPAVDFVRRFSIKTVFGFGDSIGVDRSILAIVVFCNRAMTREDASRFARLCATLKEATLHAVARNRFFIER